MADNIGSRADRAVYCPVYSPYLQNGRLVEIESDLVAANSVPVALTLVAELHLRRRRTCLNIDFNGGVVTSGSGREGNPRNLLVAGITQGVVETVNGNRGQSRRLRVAAVQFIGSGIRGPIRRNHGGMGSRRGDNAVLKGLVFNQIAAAAQGCGNRPVPQLIRRNDRAFRVKKKQVFAGQGRMDAQGGQKTGRHGQGQTNSIDSFFHGAFSL